MAGMSGAQVSTYEDGINISVTEPLHEYPVFLAGTPLHYALLNNPSVQSLDF